MLCRPMRNPFRRLLPRTERHLLLARPAASPPPADWWVQDVDVQTVTGPGDPRAAALDAFAVANGFPAGWTADMLADGATAALAVDATAANAPLAMGWAIRRPFHVDEIDATLDPAASVYLFGDFVAPSHRGRRLQLLLVAERLRAFAAGLPACTIIAPANLASLHSYRNAGFDVTDQFTRYRWRRRTWARCRPAPATPGTAFKITDGSVITYCK
jgi:hypothetical protein